MDSSLLLLLGTAATIGFAHTAIRNRSHEHSHALAGFALFASGGAITFLGL
ncbi:hypothetical protein KAW64_06285 [bacterium]|nr:hypothetical protein [bacterium]